MEGQQDIGKNKQVIKVGLENYDIDQMVIWCNDAMMDEEMVEWFNIQYRFIRNPPKTPSNFIFCF